MNSLRKKIKWRQRVKFQTRALPSSQGTEQRDLPVDDQTLVGSILVTDGTDPGGLFLVHLKVEGRVETLQV